MATAGHNQALVDSDRAASHQMASTSLRRTGVVARLGLRGLVRQLRPLTRLGPLADEGVRAWAMPAAVAAYVVAMTWSWDFPDGSGAPFPAVWFGVAMGGLAAWTWRRGALSPLAATAIVAVSAMVLTDLAALWTQPFRDIEIYLKAGERWLADGAVYNQIPLRSSPDDLSNYPFLYPPLTLPLFGALAALPAPLAIGGWIAGSAALFVAGLRLIGASWRWCGLLLLWPPFVQGLHVGNVAIPLFVLFAGAVSRPATLVVAPLFKVYSAIAGLWLLRREHWRSLLVGGAFVLLLALVTLPIVGIGTWQDWVTALQTYQASQGYLPNLYGFGLARYLPLVLVVAAAIVITLLALRARERRDQLARLGVATVVASPSLFSHGWLVALPAAFRLDTPWLWLVLGLTSCAPGPAWFAAVGVMAAAWFVPQMRKRPTDDPWHPLGRATEPWPEQAA